VKSLTTHAGYLPNTVQLAKGSDHQLEHSISVYSMRLLEAQLMVARLVRERRRTDEAPGGPNEAALEPATWNSG
jgi:hypothetical protein